MNGAGGFSIFLAVYQRDLRLAWRRRTEALLPVAFFLVAASLFPLGVGPDPQVLRLIAPGVVWVCALLAAHRARGGSVLLTSHHLHLDAEAASAGFRVLDLDRLPRDAAVVE